MDRDLVDTILNDIGLESVDNYEDSRLPQPDKGSLDRLMIDLGLESINDEKPLPKIQVVKSSK